MTPAARTRTSRFSGITLADVVGAGLVQPGTVLVSTYGAWPASATVATDATIEVAGGRHGSPSAAASTVKNGLANGWNFCAVVDSSARLTLADLRSDYSERPREAACVDRAGEG